MAKKHARKENPQSKEWVVSTCGQSDLEQMVIDGVLPYQATAGWHLAAGQRFPNPHDGEIVVFESFFYRGFVLPAHPFLRDLLQYYVIVLCHLTPNSILHIAIFINLCEAYLGIDPHFNLFRRFFQLKPFSEQGAPKIVGGVYLVLAMEWPISTRWFR